MTFFVGPSGSGNTLVSSDIGQTGNGSLTGVSTISIANGTVSTYSATELDYRASLYYNVQTVGTLYQEGSAVAQGVTPILNVGAAGSLTAPAVAWNDYDLQTEHYVVAFLISSDGYYENPLYFSEGGCADANSDCSIGGGDGNYYIEAASLYVGSTIADQTNIPQDGTVPTLNDSVYDNFLAASPAPKPDPITFKAEVIERLRALATIALIAGSAAATPASDIYEHPIPYMVDLVDDFNAPNDTFPTRLERDRVYILKDALGRPWPDVPVVIYEQFSSPIGGTPPPADGCWYNRTPLPCPKGQQLSGVTSSAPSTNQMTDHYGLAVYNAEVGFVQQYLATGFIVPSSLANSGFRFPGGVLNPGIQVPLIIKDSLNRCLRSRGIPEALLAGQPVRLRRAYTSFDNDTGPPPAPGCATAF